MEWIRLAWRSFIVVLIMSVPWLICTPSLASNLECPATLSNGQPACKVSRDVGSNAPDSAISGHVGNPIDVISGNKYQSEVDVRLGNSQLSLVRHYNSTNADQNLGLGNGWRHSYSVVLSKDGEDVRQIVQSDGRLITFRKSAGQYLADNEKDGLVTEWADNRHMWHLPDGRRLLFHGSFLTEIRFSDGGYLSLFYQRSRLHSVSDESGRTLLFHYAPGSLGLPAYEPDEAASAPGHLIAVTLPDGGSIHYEYSKRLNLISVAYPRGTQRNEGRGYRYQDALNTALLTERTDSSGKVMARWRYEESGRAISYRSGSSIRADGSESGPPNVTLEFLGGAVEGAGITRVVFRKGNTREYTWTTDVNGKVIELDSHATGVSHSAESESGRQAEKPAKAGSMAQHYPHDVLTVLALDAMGYPSRIQYQLAYDGSLHVLSSEYDQKGQIVDVSWLSGTLDGFNDGQATTLEAVRKFVKKGKASGENRELMYSMLLQKTQIAGMAAEFLAETRKDLAVGTTITGEELDDARRTAMLYDYGAGVQQEYKTGGEGEGEVACVDPLQDCKSLLRTRDYAEVAECAYADALCNTRFVEADLDLLGIELEDLHEGSFHAEVFYDKDLDEYIVTFAGTDFTSGADWLNNFEQELGFSSFQYESAVLLAEQLVERSPDANFTFVGHSLGGGLATAAAAAVDSQATVFNPAALDEDSAEDLAVDFEIAQSNTQIFSVSGEILSDVQTDIGFTNTPPGTRHVLPRPDFEWIKENMSQNPYTLYGTRLGVALHGMGAVQESLAGLIERYQCE